MIQPYNREFRKTGLLKKNQQTVIWTP